MKNKTGAVMSLIAILVLFAAFAHARGQQDAKQEQQSGAGGGQQQMNQQQALTQDPQTVRQVQQALSDKGYYEGSADGKWGSKTESALKNFQSAQGMQATGQLDQQTLASLGVSGAAAGGQQDMSSGGQSGAGGEQQGGGGY